MVGMVLRLEDELCHSCGGGVPGVVLRCGCLGDNEIAVHPWDATGKSAVPLGTAVELRRSCRMRLSGAVPCGCGVERCFLSWASETHWGLQTTKVPGVQVFYFFMCSVLKRALVVSVCVYSVCLLGAVLFCRKQKASNNCVLC